MKHSKFKTVLSILIAPAFSLMFMVGFALALLGELKFNRKKEVKKDAVIQK